MFRVRLGRLPKAVICGISALTYYGLTDAEERKTWIALPAPKIILRVSDAWRAHKRAVITPHHFQILSIP